MKQKSLATTAFVFLAALSVVAGGTYFIVRHTQASPQSQLDREFAILINADDSERQTLLIALGSRRADSTPLWGALVADMMRQSPTSTISMGQLLRILIASECHVGIESVNAFNLQSQSFNRALCQRIAVAATSAQTPSAFATALDSIASDPLLRDEEQILLTCIARRTKGK